LDYTGFTTLKKKRKQPSKKSLLQNTDFQLYFGDCIQECESNLTKNSVDLIVTDPPYGINGAHLHKHYHRKEEFVVDGYHEIPLEEYPKFSVDWINQAYRILRPGGSMYIVSGHTNLKDILVAIDQTKLKLINHIIWKYNFGVYTSKKFVTSHYHILYCIKPPEHLVTFNSFCRYGKNAKGEKNEALNYRDREDVWIINREYKPGKVKNKNELPTELLKKMIQYSSNEDDLVCDLFLGGFTTAKVAIGLNRRVCGFEISPTIYEHGMKEIKKLTPGYLMDSLPVPEEDHLTNQGKRWTDEDLASLLKRYDELYAKSGKKKHSIDVLSHELGRGYFSILNALKKMGR
jgi:site-specific DNA-methyltransferase (adenine-specific)